MHMILYYCQHLFDISGLRNMLNCCSRTLVVNFYCLLIVQNHFTSLLVHVRRLMSLVNDSSLFHDTIFFRYLGMTFVVGCKLRPD